MSIQPSEDEILREVEALRDIKRRSTAQGGPGALTIDPDLPELSPSPSSPHSSSTWPGPNGNTSDSLSNANIINDPSHLFWVPASLHPEIAPQEFREFLKEHSRDVSNGTQSNDSSLLSPGSIKVSRRKSMLSRQYKPSEKDGVEEEQVIIRRNTLSSRATPQLTINDLQKLDKIAQAVSQGEDISHLSTMLRRSLSLNNSEEAADPKSSDINDTDVPIIIPPPNQILRRAARTKIRKASLQGDGGGHRFPSSRRGTRANTISTPESSEHDHDHNDTFIRITQEPEPESDNRPSSYTDETSIFDSYSEKRDSLTSSESHERSDDDHRTATSPLPFQIPPISSTPQLQLDLQPFEISLTSAPETLHEPIPQQQLIIPAVTDVLVSRSPSPTPSDTGSTELAVPSQSPATSPEKEAQSTSSEQPPTSQPSRPIPVTTPSSSHSKKEREKEKEKEKKGLFKWGSDKRKHKTEAARAEGKESREKEKEKDSGFFGSLFGGKKKPEEANTGVSQASPTPATATALLGSNKANRPNVRTPSPQPPGSYARYPIHVERAIYRLSHIKLANARRPLLEQVLISNLMFWYLSIINKPATPSPPAGPNQTFEQITQQQMQGTPNEKEIPSQDRGDMERDRLERERQEREARERSEAARRESGRKGSLNRGGKLPNEGVRRTEVPVKGPQYESQYRAMEQEYASSSSYNFNGGGYPNQGSSPTVRTGSAPPAPMSSSPVYQQYANHKLGLTPQQVAQNKAATASNPNFYDNAHLYHPQPVHQSTNSPYLLPPGAMSPQIGSWQNSTSGSGNPASGQGPYVYNPSPSPPPTSPTTANQQRSSQSPPPRQPRSPPPQSFQSNTRSRSTTPPGGRVSRSVSAEAIPAGGANAGKLKKKSSSFQTSNTESALSRRSIDDGTGDDVPLAVWQQQHRTSHQSGASA